MQEVLDWELIGVWVELKMNKRKIGFLVDGRTEKKALEQTLDKTEYEFNIRVRNINGKSASLKSIAKQCVSQLKALREIHCQLTFIILDRETRIDEASEIGQALTNMISQNYKQTFVVVVADIMFENWLVADIEQIKEKHPGLIKDRAINGKYDGKKGLKIIQQYWNQGKYKKIVHGPQFFKVIRKNEAIKNSPSFAYFIEQLKIRQITLH